MRIIFHFAHCTYQQKVHSFASEQWNILWPKSVQGESLSHRKGTYISWKINLNTTRMQETQTIPHNLNMNEATSWKMLELLLLLLLPSSPNNVLETRDHVSFSIHIYILCLALKDSFHIYELAALSQQTAVLYLEFSFLCAFYLVCVLCVQTSLQFIEKRTAVPSTHPLPGFFDSFALHCIAFSVCHCLVCVFLCVFILLVSKVNFYFLRRPNATMKKH